MSHSNIATQNTFLTALNALGTIQSNVSNINLTQAANESNLNTDGLITNYIGAINAVMQTKAVIESGIKVSETLIHGSFKRATARHNMQVLQSMSDAAYSTPSESTRLLEHIVIKKGVLQFVENTRSIKRTQCTLFDAFNKSMLVVGTPTFDSDTGLYVANTKQSEISIVALQIDYAHWSDSLRDYTPVLESDATTTPDTQVDNIDDGNVPFNTDSQGLAVATTELANSREVVALKERDLVTASTEIDQLKDRIFELELENFNLIDNLSISKAKKLGYAKQVKAVA